MVWVGGSEVIQVVGGLEFGFEEEAGSVLGAGEEERGTPVDKVRLLVVVGVKVVDGGEYSVLVGVAEDVTERGEDTSVVTGWLEVSVGGFTVVVGSASVLVAGEVVVVA